MNDTSNQVNNANNIAQASVQPVQPVQPDQPVQPVQSVQQTQDAVKQNNQEVNNGTHEEKKEDKNTNENEDNVQFEKKFPWAVLIIIICLVILSLTYYFYWITPTRVFDEAIEDSFSNINDFITKFTHPTADTSKISLEGVLDTYNNKPGDDSIDMDSEKSIAEDIKFLDELKVNLEIQSVLKDLDFSVKFWTDNENTINKDDVRNQDFNLEFDYLGNDFYLRTGENNKAIEYKNNGKLDKYKLNYERLDASLRVLKQIKNEVVDIVQDNQLERRITSKRINGQTALAIGVKTELDNKNISDIYNIGFRNLKNKPEFIKDLATVLGKSDKEAEEKIDSLLDRKVKTEKIVVNLYMNLANTKLIGIDVKVGNYYFEINSLNGYYYIDIKKYDENIEQLDIKITYDGETGKLKGTGVLNSVGIKNINDIVPNYTKLRVDFEYARYKEKGNYSNTLDLKIYKTDDKSEVPSIKPFAILKFNLNNETNVPVEMLDLENVVPIYTVKEENLIALSNMIEKVGYRTLFVYGKLMLNELPKDQLNEQTNENSAYFTKIKEYINSEFERLYKDSLNEVKEEMNSKNSGTTEINKNDTKDVKTE